MAMSERRQEVGGVGVFWHESPAPIVYLHGVPTDADDWLPFLERSGGYAPDLPGFGRSGKPPHFDYSIPGYTRWLRSYIETIGLDGRFALVVHDWGALGLALAQEIPERIDRLVVMDAVPFLPGYRWHRAARLWRTPVVGELAMGFTFKRVLRRGVPEAMLDRVYERFDHGTQRAILKLYRSAPPATLEAAGGGLGQIGAPALVVWGERDEYIPAEFAPLYAERLGGETRVEIVDGERHWPWIGTPEVIETVTAFLRSP